MEERTQALLLQLALYSQLAPEDVARENTPAAQSFARARHYLRETAPDTGELLALLSGIEDDMLAPQFRRLLAGALRWGEQPNQAVLTLADNHYPALLRQIADPPPVLFLRGAQTHKLDLPQLAIVGSRKPSADGRRLATRFARELGEVGYITTSGLALGIDGAAHEGALQAGAGTLAVLGCGPDLVYPRRHHKLAERIMAEGVLVSEFFPGTEARAWQFPRRNRIISGLSHGVLVVEAACSSGSLITAGLAAAQGRTVFAIPGSIHNPQVRGCHALLRQGAVLVEELDDILGELGAMLACERQRGPAAESAATPQITGTRARVLAEIAYNPVTVDRLATTLQRKVELLWPELLQLELEGLIERTAGGYVRRS